MKSQQKQCDQRKRFGVDSRWNYTLTTSEGDGIQANNTEDATKGYIGIDGGIFTIKSGRDGIQAETNLSIQSAEMTVKTADGADSQSVVADESYKGMKAGGSILLASGSILSIVRMIVSRQ